MGDASQWQPAKDRGEWKSFLCHGKGHKALVSDYENFIEHEIVWAAIKSIGDYSVNEYKVQMEQDERCRKV